MLEEMNILLISERYMDCFDIECHGFSNIMYYKTIEEAALYFENNPEKFDQYHLIMLGRYNNKSNDKKIIMFEDMILKKELDKKCISVRIEYFAGMGGRFDMSEITKISFFINNELIEIRVLSGSNRNHMLSEKFVEYMSQDSIFINRIFANKIKDIENDNFEEMNDFFVSGKAQDLKVLSANCNFMNDLQIRDFATQSGFQFDFWESNKHFLEPSDRFMIKRYVVQNLNKYNIIFVPDSIFLNSIIDIIKAASSKRKSMDKFSTLLVTALENKDYKHIGHSIVFDSFFNETSIKEAVIQKDEYRLLPDKEEYYIVKSIMEVSGTIYHDKLLEKGILKVVDLNFKGSCDYEYEYTSYMEMIDKISRIRYIMKSISDMKVEMLDDLRITQYPVVFEDDYPLDGVKLEIVKDRKIISSLIIEYRPTPYLWHILIQYLAEVGLSTNNEVMPIYLDKDMALRELVKPSKEQIAVINEMHERVEHLVLPLLQQTSNEKLSSDSETKKYFKRRDLSSHPNISF